MAHNTIHIHLVSTDTEFHIDDTQCTINIIVLTQGCTDMGYTHSRMHIIWLIHTGSSHTHTHCTHTHMQHNHWSGHTGVTHTHMSCT